MFSILMPTKNRQNHIEKAVNSVLNQTYQDFELIIKDGGEPVFNILKKDKRIKYIYSFDNGISQAVNEALRLASGNIFLWANDDDCLLPDALEKILSKINGYQWGYGKIKILKDGKEVSQMGSFCDLTTLLKANYIPQPTVFWTREAFNKVGFFDEDLLFTQDYDYWIRLMINFPKFCFIDDFLAEYNLHQDQILYKFSAKQNEEAFKIRKKYESLNFRN